MDTLRGQLEQSLGHAYRIDRELGGGGMSRVFLATESSLDRKVVLKVLPSELAGGVSVERFKREIATAARLQHAHIVPLLSAGDANGLPWFSMPFVEGDTLRVRLKKGELPLGEVVRTLRDVASALAYAHARGVVHRDIKPENVLVADGVASVTDFGVAKAIAEAGAAHGGTLTSVGVALGTPAYMSPEQVVADDRVDHRADIYALGLVGYEMLAGHNPMAGRSPQATLAAQMNEMPAPIESVRPSTPPALARLVMRCIAKSAADRPQSAQELVHELDTIATPSGGITADPAVRTAAERFALGQQPRLRLGPVWVVAGALLLTAAAAFAAWSARQPTLDAKTIAVLPFEANASDAPVVEAARVAADWLAQGITQTDSVNVVASSLVSFAISDAKAKNAEIIAHVAGVTRAATVVTGSVSRFGDSLRIAVAVVDARTRGVIRAIEPVAGPASDPIVAINAMRDRLLGSIVSGDVARRVAMAGQPPSYAAYREFIAGTIVYARDQLEARPFFRRAIALDSTFAQPYHNLAASYSNVGMYDSSARVIAGLDRLKEKLSSVDRLLLRFMQASIAGDYELQYDLSGRIVDRTGAANLRWEHARTALLTLRVDSALKGFATLDSQNVMPNWQPLQTRWVDAYHLKGDHRGELAQLDRAIAKYPETQAFVIRKLRAFAAMRDLPATLALADTLLRGMADPTSVGALNTLRTVAAEFDAHGDSSAARQVTETAMRWAGQHMPATKTRPWHGAVGRAYLKLGALDSAEAHLRLALPDSSAGGLATVAQLASIHARRGDTARVRFLADSLGELRRPYDRGTTLVWRAATLASIGEREQAVQLLRQGLQQGFEPLTLHYLPGLMPLHGYPAFEALIAPRR